MAFAKQRVQAWFGCMLEKESKPEPKYMGFSCQRSMLNKLFSAKRCSRKIGVREQCNGLGVRQTQTKISPKIGIWLGKSQQKFECICAPFLHGSSDRRRRSSTAARHAGNRFRRRWLPEMKSGNTFIFVSISWRRIYSPNSLISILNPIMRPNRQEFLRT